MQCHGAPGVAQGDIGKSMQPLPGPLVDAQQHWRPRELYWVTRHGIKMSGMPAWEFRLDDEDLWAVVAFVQRLPDLSPQAYAQATAARRCPRRSARRPTPRRRAPATWSAARLALAPVRLPGLPHDSRRHQLIPARRAAAGGHGQPQPDRRQAGQHAGQHGAWLRETQKVKPLTAMPEMGVSEQDARDIAAYLATLR